MEKAKFLETLTGLAEVFRTELSEVKVALYWEALRDLDEAEFQRAAGQHLRTAKFFPAPAEILELAKPAGSGSLSAYREARDACARFGQYRSVEFEDKRTQRTIQLVGGWVSFCTSNQDDHWLSKEFCRVYDSLSDGELEHVRALRGIHDEPPVLIGANSHKKLPGAEQ